MSSTDESAPAQQQAGDGGPVVPAPRRVWLFAVIAAVVLTLDAVSKSLVAANLPQTHMPVRVLGGVIYLDQIRNAGAAWSKGASFTVVLTVIALIVVAVIVRTARRMTSTGWAIALGLILGGALGNLADRLFRSPGVGRGHVVDWISLFGPEAKYWPIFNLADSGIVCGAILAALLALFGVELNARGGSRRAGEDSGRHRDG